MVSTTSFLNSGVYRLFGTPFGIKITPPVRHYIILSNKWGAVHLAFELTELFASGELTPQDMDGIMYEMHKAYFKYREQKREKERIMNL